MTAQAEAESLTVCGAPVREMPDWAIGSQFYITDMVKEQTKGRNRDILQFVEHHIPLSDINTNIS